MAKCIKCAGIVFFAIFISCLLLVCYSVAYTLQENNSNANLTKDESITSTATYASVTIAEEILLDGKTCKEQAEKWSQAIEKSLTGKHILVTLMADWIAESDASYTTSFGTGVGLNEGRIQVPPTANITLDLNGHTISRNLTAVRRRGQVIVLYQSTLTIKDSQFDTAKILDAYKANPNRDLSVFGAGKITGGFDDNNAGAIYMEDNCLLTINSGMICNNTGFNGGAVHSHINSTLIMNNGLICNNIANSNANNNGGGIYADSHSNIIINGGLIHKNMANGFGGGIYCVVGDSSISGGIISYNKALTSIGEGGGVFYDATNVNITGGTYEYNYSEHCGGGIRIGGDCDTAFVSGAYINNNESKTYGGGIRMASSLSCEGTVKDCTIINNKAGVRGGGATFEVNIKIGAGLKIYNNTLNGKINNLGVIATLKIIENLMKDGKNTNIGITHYDNVNFTSGYTSSGNTLSPDRFFFSDVDGHIITKNSNEVMLKTGTKPTAKINWSWGSNANEKTTNSSVILPYKTGGYNISIGGGSFYKNTTASNKVSGTSFAIAEPGNYAFYADGIYLNPTFNVTIEKAKTKIAKPVNKQYVFMYTNNSQINFMPENFDANTMEIKYNRQTLPGKYTAVVKLKDNYNTTWTDGSIANLNYDFEIIHSDILPNDISGYEYIYKDNNVRKTYSSGKYFHKVNDTDITLINGNNRYVMGGIRVNTKLSVFLSNLRNDLNLIKVYDNNNAVIYDGIASNGEITDSVGTQIVGTGYRVELFENSTSTTAFDTVYLSVLGDINGDGRISASDIAYIREIAKDNSILNTMSLENVLAAMINNKGNVTNIDSEILHNVISGNIDITTFLSTAENETNNYTYLILNKENGKYERIVSETATNVLGNISVNTKLSEFKAKLATLGVNTAQIAIYNNQDTQITDDNAIVGTGWYYEINGSGRTYISVLGDLNGDGRLSASDIMYLNNLVTNGYTAIEDYVILAALILNTGSITKADSVVLTTILDNNYKLNNY